MWVLRCHYSLKKTKGCLFGMPQAGALDKYKHIKHLLQHIYLLNAFKSRVTAGEFKWCVFIFFFIKVI